MNVPGLDVTAAWVEREVKHPRQLYRSQYSPDARYIAAVGQDKLVHLWTTGDEETSHRTLASHRTWIAAMAFHPRGKHLFTADYHGVIHCWNYEAGGKPIWTIPAADPHVVRALTLTGDGRQLVSAGDDGVVKIWSATNGKSVARLEGHEECIFSLAISPNGKHLVSGDLHGRIRQWNTADWKLVRELNARLLHTREEKFIADVGGVRSLAFNEKGTRLAAGGMKEATSNSFCAGKPTVLVFDWASGKEVNALGIKGKSDGPVNALQFLGNDLLVGTTEILHVGSEMNFWKIDQPQPLHTVAQPSAYDLSLHPDRGQLLVTDFDSSGSSGNGARARHLEQYEPNGANLRVFRFHPKPPEEDAKK